MKTLSLLFLFSLSSQAAPLCQGNYAVAPVPAALGDETKCQIVGDALYVDGEINKDLGKALDQNPSVVRIELNSLGGDTTSTYAIAEQIRSRGIHTHVRSGAVCESACSLVFQAGSKRTASPDAIFMFHGSRIGSAEMKNWESMCTDGNDPHSSLIYCAKLLLKTSDITRRQTDKFFRAFVEYGASEKFVDLLRKRPIAPDWFETGNFSRMSDWRLSASELFALELNIVQALD